MHRRSGLTPLKGIAITGLVFAAALLSPRAATGQARGTLQVTATVVETQATFAGLQAARQATQSFVTNGQPVVNDVSTVAQVQVMYSAQPSSQAAGALPLPGDLIVSIDYLKN